MANPSYTDWKKDNPGKSLNEYYAKFPPVRVPKQYNTPVPGVLPINQALQNSTKKGALYYIYRVFVLVASFAIIVGFFLDLIDLSALDSINIIHQNGLELPKSLAQFIDIPPRVLHTIYIIPIGALFAIIAQLLNNWSKIFAELAAISTFIYWVSLLISFLNALSKSIDSTIDITSIIGLGGYLIIFGCICYIIDVVIEFVR